MFPWYCDNILQIYDQVPLYGLPESPTANVINLYGLKGTDGSFVTDFNIKTELTNEFSTTVAIGAQAQGQVVGEDSTGLSKWNYGLVDRYYPAKIDSLKKNNTQDVPTTEERINRILGQLKFLWLGYAEGTVFNNVINTQIVAGVENANTATVRDNVYYFKNYIFTKK